MTEQDYRISIGAYVLGALSPDEARDIEQHLRTCPDCQREYLELSEMAAALAMVPAELAVEAIAPPDDLLLQRTLRSVRNETRRPRRRAAMAAAAAVLVIAGAIGAVIGTQASSPSGQPVLGAQGTPSAAVVIRTQSASNSATGVAAIASFGPTVGGTRVQARVTGVMKGQECELWAVSVSGAEMRVGQMRATDPTTGVVISGNTPVTTESLSRLDVRTPAGEILVSVPIG